jgi:hypothetical protein
MSTLASTTFPLHPLMHKDMARSKIILPPILLIMLCLQALHSRYSAKCCSSYKVLETASIHSVPNHVCYHDEFQHVGLDKKASGAHLPKASAATANNVDRQGTVWATPFEWLSSYGTKGIKMRWIHGIAGTGICPICHHAEKPWHVPVNYPLFNELNLKLIHRPLSLSPSPTLAYTPPRGHGASADDATAVASAGSSFPPSSLVAAVAVLNY